MEPKDIEVAVVGLGLMGCSIVTCLLMANHKVVAIAPIDADLEHAEKRVKEHLIRAQKEEILDKGIEYYLNNLIITNDYNKIKSCKLAIECTIEDLEIKKSVYAKIEEFLPVDSILTSNTSAIPISVLQSLTQHPNRFFGLHWAEPSHVTRFLEIICGELSDITLGEYLYELSHHWKKEPTLVRKDIRGFITNRLMYAMYREAFYLVENGYASIEDIDRACTNNPGNWMTLVGVFRWMDLTGVPAYLTVMKDLWPTLSNSTEVPKLIKDIVDAGGRGIANGKGFYEYTQEEAKLWEETFSKFSFDIRKLANQYPSDIVEKQLKTSNL